MNPPIGRARGELKAESQGELPVKDTPTVVEEQSMNRLTLMGEIKGCFSAAEGAGKARVGGFSLGGFDPQIPDA